MAQRPRKSRARHAGPQAASRRRRTRAQTIDQERKGPLKFVARLGHQGGADRKGPRKRALSKNCLDR